MDTGATSHMASNSGILSSSSALIVPRHIVVGNGSSFPVTSSGQALIPTTGFSLCLSNVLVAPHLIKNLISVYDLTRDNLVSVEFDPWGFSIKSSAASASRAVTGNASSWERPGHPSASL